MSPRLWCHPLGLVTSPKKLPPKKSGHGMRDHSRKKERRNGRKRFLFGRVWTLAESPNVGVTLECRASEGGPGAGRATLRLSRGSCRVGASPMVCPLGLVTSPKKLPPKKFVASPCGIGHSSGKERAKRARARFLFGRVGRSPNVGRAGRRKPRPRRELPYLRRGFRERVGARDRSRKKERRHTRARFLLGRVDARRMWGVTLEGRAKREAPAQAELRPTCAEASGGAGSWRARP